MLKSPASAFAPKGVAGPLYWPGTLALDRRGCQQAVEQRLSVVGDLTEPVLKDRLDVDAFFRSIDAGHARSNVFQLVG